MKILFLESSPIWSKGLPDGLRDLGHNVKISGPLTRKKIAEMISSFNPQLLVSVGWGPEQTKEKQQWMRKYASISNIPLIYWSTEDPNFTREFTIPLIRTMKPDFVFTISAQTAAYYRKLGIRAAHLDFGFHPSIHRKVKPINRYRHRIAVVANAYPQVLKRYPKHFRLMALKQLIRPLLHAGIRVDFYGKDWEKMKPIMGRSIPRGWLHGKLPYEKANQVYSSVQIMLGLQNYRNMVTQRTYEILGSGGFLLTIDTPGVRRVGIPGRDFVLSASPSNTVRLVKHYLHHTAAREKIRRQGSRTIYKHNYTNRAKRMLAVLGKAGLLK